MTGHFSRIDIRRLLTWVLSEYNNEGSIFGIPSALFFVPDNPQLSLKKFHKHLATPLGVAAGPHTQLAQNIISAWLTGSRFIELKTVQILDELAITKPCIDAADEGYNCEWSQELKLEDSRDEYINAWIIIHILHHKLGFDKYGELGVIFNMSVGYNLEGVTSKGVQNFIDGLSDIAAVKAQKIAQIRDLYPAIDTLAISDKISDNVCLSTMHGCPPDEIEKIALHLIREKKLHTTIKLNPTLLGAENLRHILQEKHGYPITVPDGAFAHDLQFNEALDIITNLRAAARAVGVDFALKLTNTLETQNSRQLFDEREKMVYMSGRALHPLSVNVAYKLQKAFAGDLDISFAGGADSENFVNLIECGLAPVTVCTDFLQPGGYMRGLQFLDKLKAAITDRPYNFAPDVGKCLKHLAEYAEQVQVDPRYSYDPFTKKTVKTERNLFKWDCAAAPCTAICPVEQEIPSYLRAVAAGQYQQGYEIIIRDNPLASITSMVCTQTCQTRCMRAHIDEPLHIREIKKFVMMHADTSYVKPPERDDKKVKIAVIGAGPAGLATAYFLVAAGCHVEIFEEKLVAGGLVAGVIPDFRLQPKVAQDEALRVASMGTEFHFGQRIDEQRFQQLRKDFQYVVVACGLMKAKKMGLDGEDATGVMDHLSLLSSLKSGKKTKLGKRVLVIGGGDAAIDAARAALRLTDRKAHVSLVYRRDLTSMPAHHEEVHSLLSEGIDIIERTMPLAIIKNRGAVKALRCQHTALSGCGQNKREYKLTAVEGSEFDIACDSIIVGIGQESAVDFGGSDLLTGHVSVETKLRDVFIAGDLFRGASTIVRAGADGRLVARAILRKIGRDVEEKTKIDVSHDHTVLGEHYRKMATRMKAEELKPASNRRLSLPKKAPDNYTQEQAKTESSRCLSCDMICNVCITVCPNRANISYERKNRVYVAQVVTNHNGEIRVENTEEHRLYQTLQVVNLKDFCNECGNCSTFCPTSGAPYLQKPRVYLTKEGFDAARDESFYLISGAIFGKFDGRVEQLKFKDDKVTYDTDFVRITLNRDQLTVIDYEFKKREQPYVTTNRVIEMAILYEGLMNKGLV